MTTAATWRNTTPPCILLALHRPLFLAAAGRTSQHVTLHAAVTAAPRLDIAALAAARKGGAR